MEYNKWYNNYSWNSNNNLIVTKGVFIIIKVFILIYIKNKFKNVYL